jgi:nucleoside-diphosphate-sugar epimerase
MSRKLMIFGGAGRVGNLVAPFLVDHYELHVYDLRPPATAGVTYHEGDITDRDAVRAAAEGMDALVYMVMVPEAVLEDIALSYDINLKGLHLVLEAARDLGIGHVIYCSTGSVFSWQRDREAVVDDDTPVGTPLVYGMTKQLGEQVCEWFCRFHGLSVTTLRLYRPVSRQVWDEVRQAEPPHPWSKMSTLDGDLARALRLTLDARFQGYHVMSICGDWERAVVDCKRARDLIGWEPTPWPAPA